MVHGNERNWLGAVLRTCLGFGGAGNLLVDKLGGIAAFGESFGQRLIIGVEGFRSGGDARPTDG